MKYYVCFGYDPLYFSVQEYTGFLEEDSRTGLFVDFRVINIEVPFTGNPSVIPDWVINFYI